MIDNIELNKKLCEEMPYLIPRNVWTDEIVKNYDYSYINGDYDLPPGWNKLFINMCKDMRKPLEEAGLLETFRFTQIKEKYGTLRAYNSGGPQEVADIIAKYECISEYVCEECGKPATMQTKGWIAQYCDDCYKGIKKVDKAVPLTRELTFKQIRFGKDKNEEIIFDCTSEWENLFKED